MDSEAVVHETNFASNTWRVSSELHISESSVVSQIQDLGKSTGIVPQVTRILQIFWLT